MRDLFRDSGDCGFLFGGLVSFSRRRSSGVVRYPVSAKSRSRKAFLSLFFLSFANFANTSDFASGVMDGFVPLVIELGVTLKILAT